MENGILASKVGLLKLIPKVGGMSWGGGYVMAMGVLRIQVARDGVSLWAKPPDALAKKEMVKALMFQQTQGRAQSFFFSDLGLT